MKTFKGTQGQWYSKISGYKDYVAVYAVDDRAGYADRTIMYDNDLDGNHCKDCYDIFEIRKADAKLIASAPELLEVLQKVALDLKLLGLPNHSPMRKDVERAINKAL